MDQRFDLFMKVVQTFDIGYDSAFEYDSVPHQYGDEVLYQSEMHLLKAIGQFTDITVTELAVKFKRTKSACSQMVHKLRRKGLVEQIRNEKNLREYNLILTERGWEIYNLHTKFERNCLKRSCSYLNDFTTEELETYIRVQEKLNEAFKQDVEDNLEIYSKVIDMD